MRTILVGYSRIYNVVGCSLLGRNEILLRFPFGAIDVDAYVGPNPRHIIPSFKVGPEGPIDAESGSPASRARGYDIPSSKVFPADLYAELMATEPVEVDDSMAEKFHGRDESARAEVLRKAEEQEHLFTAALDFVAGYLGLHFHPNLVRAPIAEQRFAYRDEGHPYAFSTSLRLRLSPTYKWDISAEGLAVSKSGTPKLKRGWAWKKAAEVLAWLLRAWASEDAILEFVSLFIPLECVIPRMGGQEKDLWDQKRKAVLDIVRLEEAAQGSRELSKFVTALSFPPAPLAARFGKWAAAAALPGWEQDIINFRRFIRMRNFLLHAGNIGIRSRMEPEESDVRMLEDIAARYVSLALFGDAMSYQLPK